MNAVNRLNDKIESLYPGPFNPEFIYVVEPYDMFNVERTLIPSWVVCSWCELELRAEYAVTFVGRKVTVGIDWAEFMPDWSPECN